MSKDWPTVRLGEVLQLVSRPESVDASKQYSTLGMRWYGGGLFTKGKLIGQQISASKLYRVYAGDFVYNRLFAWKGSFAVAGEEVDGCYVSNEFPCFISSNERIQIAYLSWWFRRESSWFTVLALSSGATPTSRNRLKEAEFLSIEISLPPPEEQQRIVARVEELTAQIYEARNLRQQAVEEADALLIACATKIFRNALGKETSSLESVVVLERGKFSHRPRNDPRFFGGDHPWIQIGEIEASRKFIRSWRDTLNDDGLAISKKFPRGTVLISIAATIGSVAILDFDCCIPDSIVGVTPREGTDPEFMYYYLRYLRSRLEDVAPQSAQKNINLRILSALPIPTAPYAEQRRIVKELDALQAEVDGLKHAQSETTAELDALLPAILDRAFKGEL